VEVLHAEFFFSISWGALVTETVIICHKLWEEVNVQPPRALVLCPNHPVTGELFRKTGLVRQGVVGEHWVVSWGAGAVGVLTGGWVLLEGHRQVQVLLSEESSKVTLRCHCHITMFIATNMPSVRNPKLYLICIKKWFDVFWAMVKLILRNFSCTRPRN